MIRMIAVPKTGPRTVDAIEGLHPAETPANCLRF
jgi:hypothetical protein